MADESLLKQLTAGTRTKLRSPQILTSLPTIISELMQNAIDAGASQIDIGVDCAEWSCWVMDSGSGIAKEGLRKLGQGSENGRYNSSKAYTPGTLDAVSTFGFRGEALASMADLACMEISSRTARSRDSWSVIIKGGKLLYIGPSIRWPRESSGTVVSIRDAFFSLPVRRQSHPAPNRTIELIRQEIEGYALVFPNIAFSLQDTTKSKSHILKIPKTHSTLAAFRHVYGRAFTECVQEISATCGQLQIEGFISLVGAYTKSHQFLYINRHPIAHCDLHRLIDTRFAVSTFAKHAYDEGGETSLRPSVRRSPRKGEKKPVYVLNLVIPVHHIDNCLEPSKSAIELDNKNVVTSFLSQTIQSFLVNHNFAPDKTRNEFANRGSPTKKRKLNSTYVNAPSGPEARNASVHMKQDREKMPVADVAQMALCNNPSTSAIDNRTANFCPQSPRLAVRTDPLIQTSSNRRTLQLATENNSHDDDQLPNWLREALQANNAFSLQERKIPCVPPCVNQDIAYRSSVLHNCHTGFLTNRATPSQLGSTSFAAAQIRFRKDDLRQVRIISQVDCKFIACVLDNCPGEEKHDETREAAATGKTLILIDQHAADERVRVERFLKSICCGFLSHQEGSGGVEMRQLSPPVPVLLTKHEASRLADLLEFQKAFESWGFRFFGLEEIRRLDSEMQLDDGYIQVFVSAVPDIVGEKLLSGKEMQGLIQGYIGALESRELEPRDASTQQDVGDATPVEEAQWIKALRWCPRQLLDLINSKACRGAIMFNDPLSIEQCERLVKQLSATVFPFQCAHGRPSLVPLMCLGGGRGETRLEWEKVAAL